jgi:predicted nucleic acid-binding protein
MIHRPHGIFLDSTPLGEIVSRSHRMQAWLTGAQRTDSTLYTSAANLAEVASGAHGDAVLRQALKWIRVVPTDQQIGLTAGRLRNHAAQLRRKPRDLTIDSIVAATALGLTGPVLLLTHDPGDMNLLLEGSSVQVVPLN